MHLKYSNKGSQLRGQLSIANVGGTKAKVIAYGIWVEWSKGSLPMRRPYDGKNPTCTSPFDMPPGSSSPLIFSSDQLMDSYGHALRLGNSDFHIYVMGFVEYSDELGIPRRTAFCRQWRPTEARFTAVLDVDYEHEE